jgi:AraC-like DNA-binding protein
LTDSHTVYVSCFNAVLQAAEVMGVERHTLLSDAGLTETALQSSAERLPVSQFLRFYQLAESRAGSPDLGLQVGRIIYFTGLNLHLYMTTICRNLKEYLNVIPSTTNLRGDLGRVVIEPEGDTIRLEWHPLDPSTTAVRFLSDEMLASSALIVGSICAQGVPVLRAQFSYPRPSNTQALEQAFCADLEFDCAVSCLYFPRKSLRYPLIKLGYDLGVEFKAAPRSLFDAYGERDREDPFLRDMKAAIRRALPSGTLTVDTLSGDLGISRRTLQRRLTVRDSSFKQLLQHMREELALRYLCDARLGITEIAFLLGYSDQASFSNAFRGWRNCSPSEYRSEQAV